MISKGLLEGRIELAIEFEGYMPLMYYCRGWFASQDFRDAVELDWEELFPAEAVERTYARYVPAGREFPGQMLIYQCDGPARGAFQITMIDLTKPVREIGNEHTE